MISEVETLVAGFKSFIFARTNTKDPQVKIDMDKTIGVEYVIWHNQKDMFFATTVPKFTVDILRKHLTNVVKAYQLQHVTNVVVFYNDTQNQLKIDTTDKLTTPFKSDNVSVEIISSVMLTMNLLERKEDVIGVESRKKLTPEELDVYVKVYGDPSTYPQMKDDDPICVIYGYRAGDVIQTVMKVPMENGKTTDIRYVVPGSRNKLNRDEDEEEEEEEEEDEE